MRVTVPGNKCCDETNNSKLRDIQPILELEQDIYTTPEVRHLIHQQHG